MPNSTADTCILLVTYNEKPNLERLLPALLELVPRASIIVVDDNSPDGTPELLRAMAANNPRVVPVIRAGKQGYGGAVLEGLRRALDLGAQRIATMDADFSHDPADVPRLIEGLERGDVAIGSRYYRGVRVLNWHPSRLLLSLFANRYVRSILGFRVDDATSGFRAYRRAAAQTVLTTPPKSRGYSFLVELLYRLHRAGFTLVEVPIIYSERREGQSKMSKGVIFEAMFRPWILRFGPKPK